MEGCALCASIDSPAVVRKPVRLKAAYGLLRAAAR